MSFSAIIPASGLVGWTFLQRTQAAQQDTLERSPQFSREAQYFRDNIGKVTSADQLVIDRSLLQVALSAFGLQDDLSNKYFIQKVLSDGVVNDDALSNRLADPRYRAFSLAFGFGPGETAQTSRPGFADRIIEQALEKKFEVAVGEQDQGLRLALGFRNELTKISQASGSETSRWFSILGTPPVKTVFEGAMNLPGSIGSVDIDQQLKIFQSRAESVFGTNVVGDLVQPEVQEEIVRKFLLQQQIGQTSIATSASNALTLLQYAG